jgi:hypothetical protein
MTLGAAMSLRMLGLAAMLSTLLATPASAAIQYVIVIVIDGGRGDFMQSFIESAPIEFPNFTRLRDSSAYTFNARCDYTESVTVPNHLSILTGRPVRQPAGLPKTVQHGVTSDDPATTETVHNSGLNAGVYKASIFDMLHDRGLTTAVYFGKTTLGICERSWNATNGALDPIAPDNGRDKIDLTSIYTPSPGATDTVVGNFVRSIQTRELKNFTIFHIEEADYAGHTGGWTTAAAGSYRAAIKAIDGWLGEILDALRANALLENKVALMVTADHGGGVPLTHHYESTAPENYTIPFFLVAPGIIGGTSLYNYFENRYDPGVTRPSYTDPQQPVRNGDAANLAASLLGLPTVTGSTMKPQLTKSIAASRNGSAMIVSWPLYLTGCTLEYSDNLASHVWLPINGGVTDVGGSHVFSFAFPPLQNRFFRLRGPTDSTGGLRDSKMKTQRDAEISFWPRKAGRK